MTAALDIQSVEKIGDNDNAVHHLHIGLECKIFSQIGFLTNILKKL